MKNNRAIIERLIREIIEALRHDEDDQPSPGVVRRVLAAFTERPAAASWRRIVADLIHDTRRQVAMAGFRGNGSTASLAYDSRCGRIDLQLLPKPGNSWRVLGQTTAPDARAVVLLDPSEQIVARDTPDDRGRFRLQTGPGTYDLLVELDGDRVIVAPDLEIGEEASR